MKQITTLLLAMSGMAASAQTPAPAAFEVASIRTSSFKQAASDGLPIGMKISPGRVSIVHLALAKLIRIAYGVKNEDLLVGGPAWFQDEADVLRDGGLIDIEAKLPEGATADQVPLMLQTLLADRFGLKIRRESHQTDTYALVIGKGGPKFQKSESLPAAPEPPPTTAPGQRPPVKFGASTMTGIPGGGARIEASNIAGLVDYLSAMFDLPVVDKTGLIGNYDIRMETHPAAPAAGAPLDLKELQDSMESAIFAGLEKLGLKLEAQKNAVESIVIEHVERAPTGN